MASADMVRFVGGGSVSEVEVRTFDRGRPVGRSEESEECSMERESGYSTARRRQQMLGESVGGGG